MNIKCPIAARFAQIFPETAAISGVIQVPMLLPNTKAAAISKETQPLLQMTSTMAKVTLEDCTTIVTTIPMKANNKTEKKPISA